MRCSPDVALCRYQPHTEPCLSSGNVSVQQRSSTVCTAMMPSMDDGPCPPRDDGLQFHDVEAGFGSPLHQRWETGCEDCEEEDEARLHEEARARFFSPGRKSRGSSQAFRMLAVFASCQEPSQLTAPCTAPTGPTIASSSLWNAVTTKPRYAIDDSNASAGLSGLLDLDMDRALDACERKVRGASSVMGLLLTPECPLGLPASGRMVRGAYGHAALDNAGNMLQHASSLAQESTSYGTRTLAQSCMVLVEDAAGLCSSQSFVD